MSIIKLIALLMSFITVNLTCIGQEIMDSIKKDVVVITHSKVLQPMRSTAKSMILIDQNKLLKSGYSDLSQILNQQHGIIVNGANSNPAINKSTYIQGGSGEYLLYLIDGIPINDPSSIGGSFDIRTLQLNGIERIEILKGSQSTLYGSNAISGVINFITKKAENENPKLQSTSSFGSNRSMHQSIGISQNLGLFNYLISASHQSSAGISEAAQGNSLVDFDKDGFDSQSINVHLGYVPSTQLNIRPFVRWNDYEGKYDAGSFTDSREKYNSTYLNTGLQLCHEAGSTLSNLEYSYTSTKRSFDTDFGIFPYQGQHHNIEGRTAISISPQFRFLVGSNFQQFSIADEDGLFQKNQNSIWSGFGSALLTPTDQFKIEIGYRHNRNDQFGANNNYDFATSYWINSQMKVFGSYSTGFKAPLLSQLYGPFAANPDLSPEDSRYIQLGLEYSLAQEDLKFSLNYFNRTINNIIVFAFDATTANSAYKNLDRQHDYGLEASVEIRPFTGFHFTAYYTYLHGETSSDDIIRMDPILSQSLTRRPKHQVNLNAHFQLSTDWSFSVQSDNIGARYDQFFNLDNFSNQTIELNAYSIWHLNLSFKPSDRIRTFLQINNLFNKDYYEIYGYNTLDRNYTIGLNLSI